MISGYQTFNLGRHKHHYRSLWTATFTPSSSSVTVWVGTTSPPLKWYWKKICKRIKIKLEESYLVKICDKVGDSYRFRFNGQEKVNEISGIGNHNTALFWEYDTRTGRRWNVDLVIKEWESPYSTFNSNPITKIDINGDDANNINVTATLGKNDIVTVQAEKITKQTVKEERDSKGNLTITRTVFIDIATARVSPDPQQETYIKPLVETIETKIIQKFNNKGIPELPKISTKTIGTKVDLELTSILSKSIKFLESYRNENGRQYNRAIIEESKKFNHSLKGSQAPFGAAGKKAFSIPVVYGRGEISIKKIADYYLSKTVNENIPIYIPRVIYDKPNHFGPGQYRNEPSKGVKNAQQILYEIVFGWWLD